MNLERFPVTDTVLSSRYNLINWLLNVHNEVNGRTNKKQYSYDDLIKEYDLNENNNNNNISIEIITIMLLILLVIIIVVYMLKFRQ
jgi:hypothetical protein